MESSLQREHRDLLASNDLKETKINSMKGVEVFYDCMQAIAKSRNLAEESCQTDEKIANHFRIDGLAEGDIDASYMI